MTRATFDFVPFVDGEKSCETKEYNAPCVDKQYNAPCIESDECHQ